MSAQGAASSIILCAGEASGDRLGAGLITALKLQRPELHIAGIGGQHMAAAGMDCWHDISELSVMGLAEVVRHLPRLLRLRRQFHQRILRHLPSLFIGIDAPDFNLPLSAKLKQAGIPTLHYVSPSVWAWRPERVHRIAASCDHLLCLFPFEPAYYQETNLDCSFCGHPRADEIPLEDQRDINRKALSLSTNDTQQIVLAILPGSRQGERARLSPIFFAAAQQLQTRLPQHNVVLLSAQPDDGGRQYVQQVHQEIAPELPLIMVDSTDLALSACDYSLLASGTVTLEALLYHRPQVAAYRLNALTYSWVKHFKLMRSPWLTLPNVLAQQMLIPEIFQHDATAERLADEILAWHNNPQRISSYQQQAESIHRQLCKGAHQLAAETALKLMSASNTAGTP